MGMVGAVGGGIGLIWYLGSVGWWIVEKGGTGIGFRGVWEWRVVEWWLRKNISKAKNVIMTEYKGL